MKFNACKNIYPIRCIKPYNRVKYNEQESLSIVLNDLNANHCIMDNAICDNPKRAVLRHALCHSSLYACEYCESSAVSFVCPVNKTKVDAELNEISQQIVTLEEKQSMSQNTNNEVIDDLLTELRVRHIQESKKVRKRHLVWPSHTRHGRLRTVNTIRDISTAIATGRNSDEESEELTRE